MQLTVSVVNAIPPSSPVLTPSRVTDPKLSGPAGRPSSTREMTSPISVPGATLPDGPAARDVVPGAGEALLVALDDGTDNGVRAVELSESNVCEQPATSADVISNSTNRIRPG
jgi:hypothetical protein